MQTRSKFPLNIPFVHWIHWTSKCPKNIRVSNGTIASNGHIPMADTLVSHQHVVAEANTSYGLIFPPEHTQTNCPLDIPFVYWIYWTSLMSDRHSSVHWIHRTYKCSVDISKCPLDICKGMDINPLRSRLGHLASA